MELEPGLVTSASFVREMFTPEGITNHFSTGSELKSTDLSLPNRIFFFVCLFSMTVCCLSGWKLCHMS